MCTHGCSGHLRRILHGFFPGFREGVGGGEPVEPPFQVGVVPVPAAAGAYIHDGGDAKVACQVARTAVIANHQIAERNNGGHVLHAMFSADRCLLGMEPLNEVAPVELFASGPFL